MTSLKSYQELIAWKKSMDLAEQVYRVTRIFPKEELYGLTSQVRRAAVSVPSNIAEGQSRRSTSDFLRFLAIARGSLAELETQLLLATRVGYLGEPDLQAALALATEVGRLTAGLMRSLRSGG